MRTDSEGRRVLRSGDDTIAAGRSSGAPGLPTWLSPHRQRPLLARGVGVATVAYSLVLLVRPRLLAGPAEMTRAGGLEPQVALGIRAIAARDTVIGAGILLARPGRGMAGVTFLRAVCDLSDAALFGASLPTAAARVKIGGFAAGWAVLSAVAGLRAAGRRQ
jgi:hypothetical protein